MDDGVLIGEVPSIEEVEWVTLGKEMRKDTLKTLNEDAKGLATLGSSLLLVYTGALTLFKLPENASYLGLGIMAIPIVLWLVCIFFASSINFSELSRIYVNDPNDVKDFIEKRIKEKYDKLIWSRRLFIMSIAASAIILFLGGTSFQEEDPAPQTVQFLVSDNSSPDFKNASISVNESTGKTDPVKLIAVSDEAYKVKVAQGTVVEFNKDMAKAIIYN
jgi:hypothetical protein